MLKNKFYIHRVKNKPRGGMDLRFMPATGKK